MEQSTWLPIILSALALLVAVGFAMTRRAVINTSRAYWR